jgi:hypothetical protein
VITSRGVSLLKVLGFPVNAGAVSDRQISVSSLATTSRTCSAYPCQPLLQCDASTTPLLRPLATLERGKTFAELALTAAPPCLRMAPTGRDHGGPQASGTPSSLRASQTNPPRSRCPDRRDLSGLTGQGQERKQPALPCSFVHGEVCTHRIYPHCIWVWGTHCTRKPQQSRCHVLRFHAIHRRPPK